MSVKVGIVGASNHGKTTLKQAIAKCGDGNPTYDYQDCESEGELIEMINHGKDAFLLVVAAQSSQEECSEYRRVPEQVRQRG